MKIDINYQFKNLDGKPIPQNIGDPKKKKPPFTLRSACINVLTVPPQETDERTGRIKESSAEHNIMLTELAREIYSSNGIIELSADDVKLLKDYINKRYNQSPSIVTQAYEILDPTDAEKKKKGS